jgi:hypothetical protein
MRTFTRFLINLVLISGAVGVIGWLTTQKAYQHASQGAQIAMLAAPGVAAFIIGCILLHLVPAKRKASPRPSFYAAPARRGR